MKPIRLVHQARKGFIQGIPLLCDGAIQGRKGNRRLIGQVLQHLMQLRSAVRHIVYERRELLSQPAESGEDAAGLVSPLRQRPQALQQVVRSGPGSS